MKISNYLYEKIQKYVELGYIIRQDYGPLSHYNYDKITTFERKWNDATLACRGLILDETNRDIVAKPFDKFFNYEEMIHHTMPFHLPHETTIKMDGVFGFCFYYKNELRWATRWGIETPNALLAKKMFEEKYTNVSIPNGMVVMFEIIHPDTKILCEYDYSDLVVIGAFDLKADKDYDYNSLNDFCAKHQLRIVEKVPFDVFTALSVCKSLDKNEEGFVVRFSNGLRVKLKGDEYLYYARLVQGFSDKQVTIRWAQYKDIDLRNDVSIPEEFRDLLCDKLDLLDAFEKNLKEEVEKEYLSMAHAADRKQYAEWVLANYDSRMQDFLFNRYSNKPLKIREYVLTNKVFYDIIGGPKYKEE